MFTLHSSLFNLPLDLWSLIRASSMKRVLRIFHHQSSIFIRHSSFIIRHSSIFNLQSSIFTLLLLLLPLSVSAQQTLNIHTTTEGLISFTFDDQPDLTFPSAETLMVTTTSLTLEFPFSNIEKITFENTTTPVQTLTVTDTDAPILIYDLSGKLILHSSFFTLHSSSADLSPLRPGVYVVKDGKRTYKITKR